MFYGKYKRGLINCSHSKGRKDRSGDSEESDDMSRDSKDTEDRGTVNIGSERQLSSDSKVNERSIKSKGTEKNVVRTGVVLA